jgi:hypothetical protein
MIRLRAEAEGCHLYRREAIALRALVDPLQKRVAELEQELERVRK